MSCGNRKRISNEPIPKEFQKPSTQEALLVVDQIMQDRSLSPTEKEKLSQAIVSISNTTESQRLVVDNLTLNRVKPQDLITTAQRFEIPTETINHVLQLLREAKK